MDHDNANNDFPIATRRQRPRNNGMLRAYDRWITRHRDEGYRVYLVTFALENIDGLPKMTRKQRFKALEYKFYRPLIRYMALLIGKPLSWSQLPILVEIPGVANQTDGDLSLPEVIGFDPANVVYTVI